MDELQDDDFVNWWKNQKARSSSGNHSVSPNQSLRIIHVNDTHHFHLGERPTRAGNVDDASTELPVFSLASYLERARQEARESDCDLLYLSAGDEHTGTSLDELLGYEPGAFRVSPGYALQSVLRLDAATIGNHDLDRGPAILQKAIEESADFPVLSANVTTSQHLADFSAALVGETHRGIAVGIIGVTTDEQLQVRSALDPLFTVEDPLHATLRWYTRIAPVCDVVIILSHLGINVPGSRHQSKRDDRLLADALAGTAAAQSTITLIIGGHTHTVIDSAHEPVQISGIPVFQAGCNLEYIGDIEVDVQRRIASGRLGMLRDGVYGSESIPEATRGQLQSLIDPTLHELTRAVLEPVVTFDRVHRADVTTTLADRLSGECSVANAITDALRTWLGSTDNPSVIVACDASGIQSGLLAGNFEEGVIRIDDLYRILPYADSLYRAVVSPADVMAILNSNALRRLPHDSLESNGGEIGLMDWAKISRGYLHFSGNLRYRIVDDESPEDGGSRSLRGTNCAVTEVFLDGTPIEVFPATHEIIMYCNSFSAGGNQGWSQTDEESFREFGAVSLPEFGFEDTGEPFRTTLIASLRHLDTISIGRDQRVRL